MKITRGLNLLAILLLWLIPALIFTRALSWGWVDTWSALHLPSMSPHFLDLTSIPAGLETLHAGGDPLVANPADQYRRPFNYPRVWLYFFQALGVNRGNLHLVALSFCAFYLACMSYLIFRATHWADAAVLLVASLSLAPLFGIERGNTDLFIFSLIFLGCLARNRILKSCLFAAATLLKIFPIAAMAADIIRRPARERRASYFLGALVLLQFAWHWHDLFLIAHGTPVTRWQSYGALSFRRQVIYLDQNSQLLYGHDWAVIVVCWLAGALAAANGLRKSRPPEGSAENALHAEMFFIFGAIYVFTYLIGSNYDYRLIFLLPTIPLALDQVRVPQRRYWGIAYLVLLGIAENSPGLDLTIVHLSTFSIFLALLGPLALQAKELLIKRDAVALCEAPA